MTSVETPSGKSAGDENFPVGSLLIRPDLRPAIHCFYRFARAADDIADNPRLSADDKVQRLDLMADIISGRATEGSDAATLMRADLLRTDLDPIHCLDLLRAFRLDAAKLRYANWSELMEYCRYSASPVGRHVLDLHGESRDSWPSNDALCSALQVINHLQDCSLDYKNLDRVYVPLDHLQAEGLDVSALGQGTTSPGLRRVLDRLLDQTEALVFAAEDLPRHVSDRRLKWETAIIVELARRLIDRLRHQDPLAERVKLSKADVAMAVIRGLVRAFRSPVRSAATDDERAIEAQVRAAGTSFYAAMRLLPLGRRMAMYAIYAFCREVDDIADEPADLSAKLAALAEWRREIDRLYTGAPTRPISRALACPVRHYHLRKEDFIAVIDGMEMDARDPWRPMSMSELDLYCDRVASAVGRLSVRAFGATEPASDRVAASLGRALQLTNILRDIAEDADRGRLYLPLELLAKYGIATSDPRQVVSHPALPQVCAAVAEIAQRHFEDAWSAMRSCRRRPMRPAAVMGAMYWAILKRLKQRGWSASGARPRIPALVKLGIVLRYGLI